MSLVSIIALDEGSSPMRRVTLPVSVRETREKPPEKLIAAVMDAWEHRGAIDISARNIATAAGLPASSIHYHFGKLGHLLGAAQQEAVGVATRWCDARWAAIGPDARSPKMLGSLLAGMIDDWCETQRLVAFACREGQLMALRDPTCAALAAQWEAMWHSHFARLCTQMGLGELSTLTTWFFDGASALHLLRWRRPLDRAALGELCDGWGNWVEGRLASDGPWHAMGQADAERLITPDSPDAAIDPLAIAAAAILADGGVTALTHRAVAARAGMTLGMVSYRYRTSAELLQAAFHGIYHNMMPGGSAASDLDRQKAMAGAKNDVPAYSDLLGSEELAVAAARRDDLQLFAARFRYLRGRSAGLRLRTIIPDDKPLSTLDGAVFSALLSGRARSYAAAGRLSDADQQRADLAPIFARLGTG